MRFSDDFIEKVRDANNIVDLISLHTQLKPVSGGFMGRCPFPDHQERTASFSVSETRQLYHCFGCGKSGNIFTFLQQFNGLSFPDAVEFLAYRAGLSLPESSQVDTSQQEKKTQKKKDLINLNRAALQYFLESYRQLSKDHPVQQYAEKVRGLAPQTIREFQIGYAPKEQDGLVSYLRHKGFSLSLAEEGGRLIKKRSREESHKEGYADIFRDRLMFPIFNLMTEPVAFGGRIISQGEPKYINSGETQIFIKGKTLYGLSQTAKFIRSQDQAVVVEGYMDLASLYQAGVRNVVAPMGTALTQDQGMILSRMTKNVLVLFDGDTAGQRAAERSLPILLSVGAHPKGLVLPEGMDPDDFIKSQGIGVLNELVSKAPDLFSMVLSFWMQGYRGDASDKVQMSDKLRPVFGSIGDVRLKKLYLIEAAEKLRVNESWLREALRSSQRALKFVTGPLTPVSSGEEATVSSESERQNVISLKDLSRVERILLSSVMKSSSNFDLFLQESGMNFVTHLGLQRLFEKATLFYRQDPHKFDKLPSLLTSFVDRPEFLAATERNGGESQQDIEKKQLSDCLKRLRDQFWEKQASQLGAEIGTDPTQEKLQRLMDIQRKRNRNRLGINKE